MDGTGKKTAGAAIIALLAVALLAVVLAGAGFGVELSLWPFKEMLGAQSPSKRQAARRQAQTAASQYHAQGLSFFNSGRLADAIDVWLKEEDLDPLNANTKNNIGIAYTDAGDPMTALEYHKQALKLSPDFGHAWYSQGRAYYTAGRYESAIESYKRAVELRYSARDSNRNMGWAYLALGDCQNALPALGRAGMTQPGGDDMRRYNELCHGTGE